MSIKFFKNAMTGSEFTSGEVKIVGQSDTDF